MTILSVKCWETPALRNLKARIVFRGDDIRDNDGNLAVLLESKVNPTGMAGINANLAYGALENNKTTQSDVARAYLQSTLGTKVPTYVELAQSSFQSSSSASENHAYVFGNPCTGTQRQGTIGIGGLRRS